LNICTQSIGRRGAGDRKRQRGTSGGNEEKKLLEKKRRDGN